MENVATHRLTKQLDTIDIVRYIHTSGHIAFTQTSKSNGVNICQLNSSNNYDLLYMLPVSHYTKITGIIEVKTCKKLVTVGQDGWITMYNISRNQL
jgi:hypothetical protein